MKVIRIKRRELTDECWTVQFEGLSACKKCKLRGTHWCGGKGIILSDKNKKGYRVPLTEKN